MQLRYLCATNGKENQLIKKIHTVNSDNIVVTSYRQTSANMHFNEKMFRIHLMFVIILSSSIQCAYSQQGTTRILIKIKDHLTMLNNFNLII